MSDLVRNPKERFSRDEAQIVFLNIFLVSRHEGHPGDRHDDRDRFSPRGRGWRGGNWAGPRIREDRFVNTSLLHTQILPSITVT